jgi:putative ABC transport system permease protein
LLGLSAFTITQRIKEIGVRKVLGASVSSIVSLLSKDFLKLVGIASLIAFPVAWFAMNQWLQGFAYRIHISWLVFLLAAIIAAIIAFATISVQAIKAALTNPVKSLRTE